MSTPEDNEVDLVTRLSDLERYGGGRPPPEPISTDLPFGAFNPQRIVAEGGRIALAAELLSLRGLVEPNVPLRSATDVVEAVRRPEVTARLRPQQDYILDRDTHPPFEAQRTRYGPDLIAAENQVLWFARLISRRDEPTVGIFDPEIDVVYGELPLDDFLLRLLVQELVWMQEPALWERRRLTNAAVPPDHVVAGPPSSLPGLGHVPCDVAVGDDWLVTAGWYTFITVYLLRYADDPIGFDQRFESARAVLGGEWDVI